MHRQLGFVLASVLGAAWLAAACSSGSNSDRTVDGSGGGGTSGTDSGTGGLDLGTGGTIDIDGSIPEVDSGPIVEPEPDPCDANGMCAEGFVCTIADKCGKIGDSCTEQSDCQGDTYCCGADCRKDGVDEGVCIPGNVPPGATCQGKAVVGVFSPGVQCEWTSDDEWGGFVAATPLVADLPNDSGESAEIVAVSFAATDATISTNLAGAIRILRGDTCELLETIEDSKGVVRGNTTPALGDLDGDGNMEIVAYKKNGGIIAFRWNGSTYEKWWEGAGADISASQVWSGISIHNLDGDAPEVIVGHVGGGPVSTYNGLTGAKIGTDVPTGSGSAFNGFIPIVGDLNADGTADLLVNYQNQIHMVEWEGTGWQAPNQSTTLIVGGAINPSHFGFADFGTELEGGGFDATQRDGIAEIVKVEDQTQSRVAIYTLTGQEVMEVSTSVDNAIESGGHPVIGDFDNDGMPELGVAGATRFRVFDLACKDGGAGCEAPFVKWSQPSQDASSRQTGASIFDFDGDGKAEAVYADECFLRVYDGSSGAVLFSAHRTSGTWYENPVVADVDKDQNTEIVVNSAIYVKCGGEPGTPYVDPLHPGVRCDDDSGCIPGGSCVDGFCRCSSDADCDTGLTCQPPGPGASGMNTCRATHPNDDKATGGIRVLRDRLDRWASSRPLWNQHAYSITNINDNGTIPTMSEWQQNFSQMDLNNYRQNRQGEAGADDLPDVTGKLDTADLCRVTGDKIVLTGRVCNRGNRAIGSALPATFYDAEGAILCVSHTTVPVQGNGDCRAVACELDKKAVQGEIRMVVNDDGKGGRTTVECRDDNNSDTVTLTADDCPTIH